MKNLMRSFIREEDGMGTVEVVVIIAVLVAVALIFRNAIIGFVKDLMSNIFNGDDIADAAKGGETWNQIK